MDFKDVKPEIEVTHNGNGQYEVIGFLLGSRTIVEIKDIDRGPGWDKDSQSYKGIGRPGGWHRGENKAYGTIHQVHRKDLQRIVQR